jgi:virulence factor Mce-like protein
MRGRSTASVVASPVLVGAVTVLIVIVGVFLAYNANNGLPFVPTYDLNAQLPNGQKLVKGNEVRLGGFRVGVVSDVKPEYVNGKAVAEISMRLDKTVMPLSKDTQVGVRPRSALGLKYVTLIPGHSKQTFEQGDTIPLSQSRPREVEYEDVFSTFDQKTRDNSRTALKGFGDAFAGRGSSINEAIGAFNPFFKHLTPVMKTLDNPNTHLTDFFKNIGRASAEVAPVAQINAEVFGKMAKTFDAFSACAKCLQDTIAKSPPTLQSGIDSFKVQEPFLAQFAILSKKLRPVATTLHQHLGTINSALATGIPVLPRTVTLNNLTGQVFGSLDYLARQPQTLPALQDLHTTFLVARPLLEYAAPYQTVCNNAVAFLTGLAGDHSIGMQNGTAQNALVKTSSNDQKTAFGGFTGRPADVPANEDPQTYMDSSGNHFQTAHLTPMVPAVDAQGNADCQNGQYGYISGPYNTSDTKYPPSNIGSESYNTWEQASAGGSHTVSRNDNPGLEGPGYVPRRLGINNIRDVP